MSISARPEATVSTMYRLPQLPSVWTKVIPAEVVTFLKQMGPAWTAAEIFSDRPTAPNHRDCVMDGLPLSGRCGLNGLEELRFAGPVARLACKRRALRLSGRWRTMPSRANRSWPLWVQLRRVAETGQEHLASFSAFQGSTSPNYSKPPAHWDSALELC